MFKVPKSIRELQPHAIWYVIERVFIASLVGGGGGEMLHVNPFDLGLLALGLILFARPLFGKKHAGPSVEDQIESLNQKWIIEAETRNALAVETRDAITNLGRSAKQWTDVVNGKVIDLTEKVDILIADYHSRRAG